MWCLCCLLSGDTKDLFSGKTNISKFFCADGLTFYVELRENNDNLLQAAEVNPVLTVTIKATGASERRQKSSCMESIVELYRLTAIL